MKSEFLDFINKLIEHDKEYANSIMNDDVKNYLNILREDDVDHPEVTDSGKVILKYLQDNDSHMGKARDIADGLGWSSRKVSGALRKLVTDRFVEKVGNNPVVYSISEKGKNYKID